MCRSVPRAYESLAALAHLIKEVLSSEKVEKNIPCSSWQTKYSLMHIHINHVPFNVIAPF